jgi:hypothetical protein
VKCSEESHNTLKFASRAKKIKMKATVNESVDDKTLLSQYREEIDQLKAQLAMFQEMSSNSFNVALSSAHKRDVPESETDADAENNDEDTEQNQRLILQVYCYFVLSIYCNPKCKVFCLSIIYCTDDWTYGEVDSKRRECFR